MSQVVSALGPTANQTPIPAAPTLINDMSIIHVGTPGPILLLARVTFDGGALAENVGIALRRNGVPIFGADAGAQIPVAANLIRVITWAIVPDSQPGDVYTLWAQATAATAGVLALRARMTMLGIPAQHSLAPQGVATP
jgi:hypothetical protein